MARGRGLIVRANVEIRGAPRPENGMIFTGTMEQITDDVEGRKRIGAARRAAGSENPP